MNMERPFSGPISLTLAGLMLAAIAAWSFASGLSHALRQPRADATTAQVVLLSPTPQPDAPQAASLADMAAAGQQSPPPPPRHRPQAQTKPPIAPEPTPAPPPQAPAAADQATDAAAATPAPEAPPASAEPTDPPSTPPPS